VVLHISAYVCVELDPGNSVRSVRTSLMKRTRRQRQGSLTSTSRSIADGDGWDLNGQRNHDVVIRSSGVSEIFRMMVQFPKGTSAMYVLSTCRDRS